MLGWDHRRQHHRRAPPCSAHSSHGWNYQQVPLPPLALLGRQRDRHRGGH